jgi:hypothetical protein
VSTVSSRPAVSDLVYRVYNAPVHVEFFSFAARFQLSGGEWRAEVGLCSDGHVITFRHGRRTLVEVISGSGRELPESRVVRHRKLRGNRTERCDAEAGLVYQCCLQVERLAPEVYHRFHEELLLDSARLRVACRFASGNRLGPAPLSLMRIEEQPRSLLVHAFHSFPTDLAVVKSQTLIEI